MPSAFTFQAQIVTFCSLYKTPVHRRGVPPAPYRDLVLVYEMHQPSSMGRGLSVQFQIPFRPQIVPCAQLPLFLDAPREDDKPTRLCRTSSTSEGRSFDSCRCLNCLLTFSLLSPFAFYRKACLAKLFLWPLAVSLHPSPGANSSSGHRILAALPPCLLLPQLVQLHMSELGL